MSTLARCFVFYTAVVLAVANAAEDLPLLGQTYSLSYDAGGPITEPCAAFYARQFELGLNNFTTNYKRPTECDGTRATLDILEKDFRIYTQGNKLLIFMVLTINGSSRLDVTSCQEALYSVLTAGRVNESIMTIRASNSCASAQMKPVKFSVVECSYFCQQGKVFEGSRNCFRSSALKANTWKCEDYMDVMLRPDLRARYSVEYVTQQTNVSDLCGQYYSSFLLLSAIDAQNAMREICLPDGALVNVFAIGDVKEFDKTLEFGIEVFISAYEWEQLHSCSLKLERGFRDGEGSVAFPSTVDSFEDCGQLTISDTQRGSLADCDWMCPLGVPNIFGCGTPTPDLLKDWGCYPIEEPSTVYPPTSGVITPPGTGRSPSAPMTNRKTRYVSLTTIFSLGFVLYHVIEAIFIGHI